MLVGCSPHRVVGPFGLPAPPTGVDLRRGELAVEIEPGSPLMAGSRLRRATSFTPASLVAPVGLEVVERTPDVMRLLFELPARIAESHDLAVATGKRPFPGMPSSPAPQRRQDAHLCSRLIPEVASCRIGHEPAELAWEPPHFMVTVTHPTVYVVRFAGTGGRGEGPARRCRPAAVRSATRGTANRDHDEVVLPSRAGWRISGLRPVPRNPS